MLMIPLWLAPLEVIKSSFPRFVELSSSIGLSINFQKCLVIGRSSVDFNFGESSIPFVNYSDECVKFLGNYIGNDDKIKETLTHKNNCIFQQLNQIVDLDVGKQVSFAMLQVCFGGKINHFLRGLPPELTLELSRNFNSLRTNFVSYLVGNKDSSLPSHCFTSTSFGGIGFTKAKYMRDGAFLGSLKNFLFEFQNRYPVLWKTKDFLLHSPCTWLISLQNLIESLDSNLWSELFPVGVTEIQQRSIFSLPLCVRKLQKKFVLFHESLDFKNRISLAKTKSPAFCAFLNDISSSAASSFVSRLPRKFCFNLKDHEWLINMRLRLGLWPSGLLKHSPCLCGRSKASNFHHLVNCHQFIHFRSIIHNSIRDTCLDMFKANGFHGKIEPLLANLSDQPKVDRSRGDLIGPWLSCQEIIMDFTTVDPCNSRSISKIFDDDFSALEVAEKGKNTKYCLLINQLNVDRYNSFVFQPFAMSIYGNIGPAAQAFLTSFGKLCSEYGKAFNENFWLSKLTFALFRSMHRYFNSILGKLFGDGQKDHSLDTLVSVC
ncbi:hypothetical protein GEMRC1_004906 [Eukaryota sp. GEM-RC1]